jgi:hypothetical protein
MRDDHTGLAHDSGSAEERRVAAESATEPNEILGWCRFDAGLRLLAVSAAMERDGRPMRPLGVAAAAQHAGECVLPSFIDRTRDPGSL